MFRNKKGFTLVELLAVIVILAIILAIAVPTISSLIQDAKEKAMAANAKMVIKAIDYKLLQDTTFDVTTLTAANVESLLGVDAENIETLSVSLVSGKPSVSITGTGQWEGLSASGTFDSISVSSSSYVVQTITDSRDGNEYQTVQIGTQTWFAENLRYTGSGCLSKTWDTASPHDACKTHTVSWSTNAEVSYQRGAAMNGSTTEGAQGLCPTGWHIPTDAEWVTLESFVDPSGSYVDTTEFRGVAGTILRSETDWTSANPVGTNDYGFNAKPAGFYYYYGMLLNVNFTGSWWTSTFSSTAAWYRSIQTDNTGVYRTVYGEDIGNAYGYSVRCIQD